MIDSFGMAFASVRTLQRCGVGSVRGSTQRVAQGVHLLQVCLDAVAAHHAMAVEKRAALRNRALHDRDPGAAFTVVTRQHGVLELLVERSGVVRYRVIPAITDRPACDAFYATF